MVAISTDSKNHTASKPSAQWRPLMNAKRLGAGGTTAAGMRCGIERANQAGSAVPGRGRIQIEAASTARPSKAVRIAIRITIMCRSELTVS